MTIKLIVGLRNPGAAYEQTRHNAGGWFVEALAKSCGASFKIEKKLQSELVSIDIKGHSCRAILPLTFMNHSGQSTRATSQFFQINANEILVAHDDLDLPAGRIKLKTGGGHGGHNGLRDIISHLGCSDFHRLRIGIGHPGQKELVLNYVLGKPSIHDRQLIIEALDRGIVAMPTLLSNGMAAAMNELNI